MALELASLLGPDRGAHMGYSAAPSAFGSPLTLRMDDRRKKLTFRAWRRGFREIDLILGGFADRKLVELDEAGLEAFERLLEAPDQDVYEWITGQAPTPADYDTPTLALIRAFQDEVARPE
jgi:antitoxin CptB